MKISVIIPTLNEADKLPGLLPLLVGQVHELMVADGGSTDQTGLIARWFGAKFLSAAPGRACQMNQAAGEAAGDWLWFLHADCRPPVDWKQQMERAARDSSIVGGGFRIRLDAEGLRYRILDWMGLLRVRMGQTFYGDQGVFVRADLFRHLKGYQEKGPEDLDFSIRLKKAGKVICLPGPLLASARRWQEEGWWKTSWLHLRLLFLHAMGRDNLLYPSQKNKTPEGLMPGTVPGTDPDIALIVMAKIPIPGQVKTRLIPALGEEGAADLAHRLLKETVTTVQALGRSQPILAVWPPDQIDKLQSLLEYLPLMVPQSTGHLGVRMKELFERAFAQGFRGVLMIGADHPGLPKEYLEEGLAQLETGKDQLLLGPTEDGGYYGIGLTGPHPELFEEIPWSTDQVLEKTQEKAALLNLPVTLLPSWFDLDRPEDLARVSSKSQQPLPSVFS